MLYIGIDSFRSPTIRRVFAAVISIKAVLPLITAAVNTRNSDTGFIALFAVCRLRVDCYDRTGQFLSDPHRVCGADHFLVPQRPLRVEAFRVLHVLGFGGAPVRKQRYTVRFVMLKRPQPAIRQAVVNRDSVGVFRVSFFVTAAAIDNHRQIQVMPFLTTPATQQIAAQVVVVNALHDDNHRRRLDRQS
ncbi:Uncharacterised protein [Enterobacter hormaechei]|nr:Uncharacterised protein [Enterobacter hormaechei]SAH03628.1 Uncharacterised protein [Enterobacter hormaechei]